MAGKKFAAGTEEYLLYKDYYNLCQMLWISESSDEYWEYVEKKINEFLKKHNTEFARSIALDLLVELERKYKQMKKNKE